MRYRKCYRNAGIDKEAAKETKETMEKRLNEKIEITMDEALDVASSLLTSKDNNGLYDVLKSPMMMMFATTFSIQLIDAMFKSKKEKQ